MTFGSSGTGMDNSIPEVRDREGNEKKHSQISGMKKSIPKIWEQEGNKINPFPQFGNGNQTLSFPRIPGNGNGNEKKI